jgi:hypothetical protein
MADKQYRLTEWKKKLEDDFEMPVRELVRLFIKDRYSMKMAAATMGIDVDTLRRYCRQHKMSFPDRINLRDECKPKPNKLGIVRNPWGCKGKPKKRKRKAISIGKDGDGMK